MVGESREQLPERHGSRKWCRRVVAADEGFVDIRRGVAGMEPDTNGMGSS